MTVASRIRSAWLFTIKHSLNRLTLRSARGRRGPFSIVRHVGRKSGKTFETPIIAQPTDGGFVIELTYGEGVQWYRNVVAANGCEIIRHGVTTRIVALRPLSTEEGLAAFPASQRRILKLLKRTHFVRLLAED